ncbi:MAG TPA: hypothetical protein ENI07_08325 [Desulfobacterales bacterium]|nr:hypothetical protein [Desulfobacterales bacterium]
MSDRDAAGTVFFIDMRNFTLLCSKMSGNIAEDRVIENGRTQYDMRLDFLIDSMSRFYDEWLGILKGNMERENISNAIFQSTGDGIMIAVEGKLHYLTAFEASIEMARQIRKKLDQEINPKLKELGINRLEDRLDFGVGMCSGQFKYVEVPYTLSGAYILSKESPGTKHRETYMTILGTAPNYAARIEKANKDHCESYIMIAEPTVRLLCDHYDIPFNDTHQIKDRLQLQYLWKHRFRGISEIGLYIYLVNGR